MSILYFIIGLLIYLWLGNLFLKINKKIIKTTDKILDNMVKTEKRLFLDYNAHLEIHFHQPNEVSILLKNNTLGEEEIISDLFLLSFYAVRHIANCFSTNRVLGEILGHALLHIEDNDEEIFSQQSSYDISKNPYWKMLQEGMLGIIFLPPGSLQGGKRFIADMRISGDKVNFKLKPVGFGVLGYGLNWYSPISVLTFIKYLGNKYSDNTKASAGLLAVCRYCGKAANHITVLNQPDYVIKAISAALKESDYSSYMDWNKLSILARIYKKGK